jgi:hypothetical protein
MQSSWTEQLFDTGATVDRSSGLAIPELHVPADQPLQLTLKNVGSVAQHFTFESSDPWIDYVIAAGSSRTVTAIFAPGWTYFSTSGAKDTLAPKVGYLYAEDVNASTPVASPDSAFSDASCPTAEAWLATAEANGLPTQGVRVSAVINANDRESIARGLDAEVYFQPAPNNPSRLLQVTALSDIPNGDRPSAEVQEEISAQLPHDLSCFTAWGYSTPYPEITVDRMTLLTDGNVGVLLDSDPEGYGTPFYVVYMAGSQQWLISSLTFVLPDEDFQAPPDLQLQTSVQVQAWSVSSSENPSPANWPSVAGVPAKTDIDFEVKNLGNEPLTFAITGTDVNVEVESGESKDVIVNLEPGTYRFSLTGPSGVSSMVPGFVFAMDASAVAATPAS